MTFFVLFWVVIRTTSCEVSLVLGMLFDLGVPIQYYSEFIPHPSIVNMTDVGVGDEGLKKTHEKHLSAYWPIFIVGSIFEAASFVFFHPDLFTLIVCMKTTICLARWFTKNPDGSKVRLSSRCQRLSSYQQVVLGGGSGTSGSTSPSNMPEDPRIPFADKALLDAGYEDPEARAGMIYWLLEQKEEKEAKRIYDIWTKNPCSDEDKERRNLQYKDIARKKRSASGGRKQLLSESVLQAVDDHIKEEFKKPAQRAQRDLWLKSFHSAKSPEELQSVLNEIVFDTEVPRGTLADVLDPRWVESQKKLLLDNDLGGLGLGRTTVDVMMADLWNQPSKADAEKLAGGWDEIREIKHGRDKPLYELTKRYQDRLPNL